MKKIKNFLLMFVGGVFGVCANVFAQTCSWIYLSPESFNGADQ